MSVPNLLVYLTPSHEDMFRDYLTPSLPDGLTTTVVRREQISRKASYQSPGWTETFQDRLRVLLDHLVDPDAIYGNVDVDLQFIGDDAGLELMREFHEIGREVVFMDDGPGTTNVECCGFFLCRGSTRDVWERVLERSIRDGIDDQRTINKLVREGAVNPERIGYFDKRRVWSPRRLWSPGDSLDVPDEILVHHANYVIGVENKVRQLRAVRAECVSRGRYTTTRLGNEYGGYELPTRAISPSATVYSVGLGEDCSFEDDLLERTGVRAVAFDGTPRSIVFAESRHGRPWAFEPLMVSDHDGDDRFYDPANPAHVSLSVHPTGTDEVPRELPVVRLSTIMTKRGDATVDVLKLDVEGAEVRILSDAFSEGVLPTFVCLDVHRDLLSSAR